MSGARQPHRRAEEACSSSAAHDDRRQAGTCSAIARRRRSTRTAAQALSRGGSSSPTSRARLHLHPRSSSAHGIENASAQVNVMAEACAGIQGDFQTVPGFRVARGHRETPTAVDARPPSTTPRSRTARAGTAPGGPVMALLREMKDVRGGCGDADILHRGVDDGRRARSWSSSAPPAPSSLADEIRGRLPRSRSGNIVRRRNLSLGARPHVQSGICYMPQVDNVFPRDDGASRTWDGRFPGSGDLRRLRRIYGSSDLPAKRRVRVNLPPATFQAEAPDGGDGVR